MSFWTDARNFVEDVGAGAALGWGFGGPGGAILGAAGGVSVFAKPNRSNLSQRDLLGQSAVLGTVGGLLAAPTLKAATVAGGPEANSFSSLLHGQIAAVQNGVAFNTAGAAKTGSGIGNFFSGIFQPGALTTLGVSALLAGKGAAGNLIAGRQVSAPVMGPPAATNSAGGVQVVPIEAPNSQPAPIEAGMNPIIMLGLAGAGLAAFWMLKKK